MRTDAIVLNLVYSSDREVRNENHEIPEKGSNPQIPKRGRTSKIPKTDHSNHAKVDIRIKSAPTGPIWPYCIIVEKNLIY